jgi:3-dehydroquinate synthase
VSKENIILIGFSYTGKSLAGERSARRLGFEFVDLDARIEREQDKAISQIFSEDGEVQFRHLEKEMLRRECEGEGKVLACGGGAILDKENRKLMRESGMMILLEASEATIFERMQEDKRNIRPLLSSGDASEKVKSLKSSRNPYYHSLADWTIHTDSLTPDEVSTEIVRGWNYYLKHPWEKNFLTVITPTRCYPAFVGRGEISYLGETMKRVGLQGKAYVISDDIVFPKYGDRVLSSLSNSSFDTDFFILPAGENTKELSEVSRVYDFLIQRKVERKDIIIALGGGMVGDLAGFVAATMLRGIPLVQVPTTLLSMVDSAIGGKTGVNHPQGKNLIGSFYQPFLVVADVDTLVSLPRREYISGWAEVIKYGMVFNPELCTFLEKNVEDLLKLEEEAITLAIKKSIQIKARVVGKDEREEGEERTLLNYGHTIAHGLEAATGYERFLHGEAVSIGMMGGAMISQKMGILKEGVVENQKHLLSLLGLPISFSDVDVERIRESMELDKKIRDHRIHWVLLYDVGVPAVRDDVPLSCVMEVLHDLKAG